MNILEVKNLSKIYGKGETAVRALDNVSFSVKISVAKEEFEKHRPAMGKVAQFFEALSNSNHDGILIVNRSLFLFEPKKPFFLFN